MRYLNDWIWLRLSNRYNVASATHSLGDVYNRWVNEVTGSLGVDLVDFYLDRIPDAESLNDAEYAYWAGGPLQDAVLWLDAGSTHPALVKVPNLGSGGSVLDAQYGDGSTVGTFPTLLEHTGENYVYFPGVSSNLMHVPDSAALSITGDLELVMRLSLDDMTPSPSNTYSFSKRATTGNQRSWLVEHTTGGFVALYWSNNGTSEPRSQSTAALPVSDGQVFWLKITLDVDNGASGNDVKFWWAADQATEPVSWTQLGSTVTTAGTTSVFDSTARVQLSGWQDGGSTFAGKVYRAIVRNGIGGSTVLDINPAIDVIDGARTSFTCTTGQTVTVERANPGRKTVLVDRNVWLFGTDDYLEVSANPNDAYVTLTGASGTYISAPDASGLDITGDIDIRVRVALDDWTPGADTVLVGKLASPGNQRSYSLRLTTGGTFYFTTSPDGINGVNTLANAANALTNGQTYWIRATLDVDDGAGNRVGNFYWAPDSLSVPTVWTSIGTTVTTAGTTSIYVGTAPLEIGSFNGGTSQASGKFYRAQILNGIGGTIVADWQAAGYAAGGTSYRDAYANIWTLNGAASVANTNPLNFGPTDSFTIMAVRRTWGTINNNAVVGKGTSGINSDMQGYQMFFSSGVPSYRIGDGTTRVGGVTSPTPPAGDVRVITMHRDVTSDRLWAETNGVENSGRTTDATTGTLASGEALFVGGTVATGRSDMELFAVAVWRRTLTDAEIDLLAQYYGLSVGPWGGLVLGEDGVPILTETGDVINVE